MIVVKPWSRVSGFGIDNTVARLMILTKNSYYCAFHRACRHVHLLVLVRVKISLEPLWISSLMLGSRRAGGHIGTVIYMLAMIKVRNEVNDWLEDVAGGVMRKFLAYGEPVLRFKFWIWTWYCLLSRQYGVEAIGLFNALSKSCTLVILRARVTI